MNLFKVLTIATLIVVTSPAVYSYNSLPNYPIYMENDCCKGIFNDGSKIREGTYPHEYTYSNNGHYTDKPLPPHCKDWSGTIGYEDYYRTNRWRHSPNAHDRRDGPISLGFYIPDSNPWYKHECPGSGMYNPYNDSIQRGGGLQLNFWF